MGLFNKLRNEFIDIIEWTDNTSDTMIWRFPRYQAEIKNGAQLTVRESQVAILVNEGQFADIYQPGRHVLSTNNMPILSTIMGWKYGFNSPFKVDVYFVNTKQFLNIKWGTANPIMLRDPEFGPIRMRAFGSYCFRVNADPRKFITNVAGTSGSFTAEAITEQLRNFVITKFTDYLGESKIAALDLASNLNEFSADLTEGLKPDFEEYGLELTKFLVENISLPEAVEKALDKRTSMGVIGNMGTYTQMQFADSLVEGAASGGGNVAGNAMGMGEPNGWTDGTAGHATSSSTVCRGCRRTRHAAASTSATNVPHLGKRPTARPVRLAPIAANGAKRTANGRYIRVDQWHGIVGFRQERAGFGCPLRRNATAATWHVERCSQLKGLTSRPHLRAKGVASFSSLR